MSTIVVKNLPEPLHAQLKQRAERNHRSMTKEVIHLIEIGLQTTPVRKPLPAPVTLRSGKMIDIEAFEAAAADGRK